MQAALKIPSSPIANAIYMRNGEGLQLIPYISLASYNFSATFVWFFIKRGYEILGRAIILKNLSSILAIKNIWGILRPGKHLFSELSRKKFRPLSVKFSVSLQPEETTVMNLPVSALSQLDKEESPIQVIFDPATQKLQLVRGASPQVIQQAVQQVPAEMPGIPAPVPEVAPVVPAVSPPQPTIKQVMRTGVPVQLVTTKSGQQIIQLQSGVTLKGVHLQPITTKDVDVGKEMIMGEPLQVKKSVVNQQVLKAVPVQTVKTLKLAPGQSLKGLRLQGGWRIQGGSDAVNPHARAVATGTMKTPQKRAPFGKPKASSSQARPSTPGTVYLSSSDGTYMPLQMTSVGGQLGYTIPADAVEPNKAFRIQTPAGAQLEGVVQAGDSQGMQLQIKQPPAAASSPAEVAMVEAEPEEEQPFTPNIKTNTAVDRVISFDSLSESQKRKILHQMKNPISDPMPAVVEQDVQQSPVLLVQQPALYESPRRGRPMSPDLELVTMKPPSAIMEGDIVPEEEEVIVTHMETPTLINEPTEGQQNGGWSLATTLEPQEQPVVNKKSAKKVRSLSFPVKVGFGMIFWCSQEVHSSFVKM